MVESLIIFILINYVMGWVIAYFIDNPNNGYIPYSEIYVIAESMRTLGFFITMLFLLLYKLFSLFLYFLSKKHWLYLK